MTDRPDPRYSFARFEPVTGPEAERVARGEPVGGGEAPAGTVEPSVAPATVQGAPEAISGAVLVEVVTSAAPAVPARPGPRFLPGGRERIGSVAIPDAIEDSTGRVWKEIPLRRPTSREVGDYFEALRSLKDPAADLYWPVFAEADGTPVPAEVLDFLDDDDKQDVFARAEDFLPFRLLRLVLAQRSASPPTDGDSTAQTSST